MGLAWEGRSRGWGWEGRSGGWGWEQGYQDGATCMWLVVRSASVATSL